MSEAWIFGWRGLRLFEALDRMKGGGGVGRKDLKVSCLLFSKKKKSSWRFG